MVARWLRSGWADADARTGIEEELPAAVAPAPAMRGAGFHPGGDSELTASPSDKHDADEEANGKPSATKSYRQTEHG